MKQETTKLQKEFIQIVIQELKDIKETKNVNAFETYDDIDKLCKGLMDGKIEPQIHPIFVDRLDDLLHEFITLVRDLER